MESVGVNKFTEQDVRQWLQANQVSSSLNCFEQALQLMRAKTSSEDDVLNICLSSERAEQWIGYAFAGILEGHRLWFCSPRWMDNEWNQVKQMVTPDLCFGRLGGDGSTFSTPKEKRSSQNAEIMIATGGSSGSIKFARHSLRTMSAAVEGMARFFFNRPVNRGDFAYRCDLPLWHVSGWMQLFRSYLSNSRFLLQGSVDELSPQQTRWLSMVPVQLRRAFDKGEYHYLRAYDYIVLGGGACPEDLIKKCLKHDIMPWVTYGMTETAGMVAGKRIAAPQDINRPADCFPHVSIRIEPLSDTDSTRMGEIIIESKALCLGYNLDVDRGFEGGFRTRDLGFLDNEGRLEVVDRMDTIINTGGEKVLPREVKDLLLTHEEVEDCLIVGVEDEQWGKKVVAFVVLSEGAIGDVDTLKSFLRNRISAYKIPKDWKFISGLPYDEKGKLSKYAVAQMVENY